MEVQPISEFGTGMMALWPIPKFGTEVKACIVAWPIPGFGTGIACT